jgi:hypothetical protein
MFLLIAELLMADCCFLVGFVPLTVAGQRRLRTTFPCQLALCLFGSRDLL